MSASGGAKAHKQATSAPFGEPEGQRSDIDDDFIEFDPRSGWGGIATGERDSEARLLIGRKGAGKTLYQRRLRASAAKVNSLYVDEVRYDPPQTDVVVEFTKLFSDTHVQIEWWAKLWHRCILRTVASHVTAGALNCNADPAIVEKLKEYSGADHGRLLRKVDGPIPVYRQIDEVCNEHAGRNSLAAFLQNPFWTDLEGLLAKVLHHSPPLYLFLDALDEHFERAPRQWLRCQEGLFQQTVQMLRSDTWNRLHLIVSLRDIVYASMLQHSEHSCRLVGDSHLRLLNWHRGSIEQFLKAKLRQLDKRHFATYIKGERTVENWLGIAEVVNDRRGIKEPVLQYLLRHTRLLPRDIILLGNQLCEAIEKGLNGQNAQTMVRSKVHEAASRFGHEQLLVCANEIISTGTPRLERANPNHAVYADAVELQLKQLLQSFGSDRFSCKDLQAAREKANEEFNCDVFTLLWRNGLIGAVECRERPERFRFYDHDSLNSFLLPADCEEYVLHPIVLDATAIRAKADTSPVVPYL